MEASEAREARDAALAAVQADGLELRKLGEFRADKEPQYSRITFAWRSISMYFVWTLLWYVRFN